MTSQSNFVTCKTAGSACPLLGRLERLEQMVGNRLSSEDRRTLERLLPGLGGAFGSDAFFVWQIDDPAILAFTGGNMLKMGKLLGKAANSGVSFGGLTVTKAGKKQNAQRWRLRREDDPI